MNDSPQREPAPGAMASMVLGIISLVTTTVCCVPPVSLILGIIAMVMAGKARKAARANPERYHEGPRMAGYICGLIGMILGIIGTLIILLYLLFVVMLFTAVATSLPAHSTALPPPTERNTEQVESPRRDTPTISE